MWSWSIAALSGREIQRHRGLLLKYYGFAYLPFSYFWSNFQALVGNREALRVWLMARRLPSLWFSPIQTRRIQKTSARISRMQLTLKVLIGGHSPSSQRWPASLVITALHHWASAKQVSGQPMGGAVFTVQQSRSICCKLTGRECCVGSWYKSTLGPGCYLSNLVIECSLCLPTVSIWLWVLRSNSSGTFLNLNPSASRCF